MPDDPVARILGLVAEGRLTPDEAARLLDALDGADRVDTPGGAERTDATGSGFAGGTSFANATSGQGKAAASSLRIQVLDTGRAIVNLRVPLSLGRAALARVPGLSDSTSERVREAIEAGITGPILDVDDDGDGVRISIE
jgi:hypothetical protein